MRRLCTLDAASVDVAFAEYCFALFLFAKGLVSVYPMVVGEERVEAHSGKTFLDNLFQNKNFRVLRDVLPRTVPTATWRFVAHTLAAVGLALPPGWDALTVREVMCGSACGAVPCLPTTGVFQKDIYVLEGDKDKLRLFLMREFAEAVRRRIDIAAAST
jgi:hypothetical protein